jgi:hypothetical protein
MKKQARICFILLKVAWFMLNTKNAVFESVDKTVKYKLPSKIICILLAKSIKT